MFIQLLLAIVSSSLTKGSEIILTQNEFKAKFGQGIFIDHEFEMLEKGKENKAICIIFSRDHI